MSRPTQRGLVYTAIAMATLAPTSAQAHLTATGMGPFYDGISHFSLSPEDFLPVIALGFLAGLRGTRTARALLAILPLIWFVAGLLTMQGLVVPNVVLSSATALLFLVIGGLLAANAKAPLVLIAAVGATLAIVRGIADLTGIAESSTSLLTLMGMCASVFTIFALAASATLSLERLWLIVAARVCGSWVAAVGLLLAGWILRYGAAIG